MINIIHIENHIRNTILIPLTLNDICCYILEISIALNKINIKFDFLAHNSRSYIY